MLQFACHTLEFRCESIILLTMRVLNAGLKCCIVAGFEINELCDVGEQALYSVLGRAQCAVSKLMIIVGFIGYLAVFEIF